MTFDFISQTFPSACSEPFKPLRITEESKEIEPMGNKKIQI